MLSLQLSLQLSFQFRVYQRSFRQPLRTAHGLWSLRQGLIVRLATLNGQVGYGEIAPLPDFGTETLAEAIAFCTALGPTLTPEAIAAIPVALPATQFGLGCAWEMLQAERSPLGLGLLTPAPAQICVLLPVGAGALQAWQAPYAQGHRTFKWKIGVASLAQELAEFAQLCQQLPPDASLRLDANGGLSVAQAKQWLAACDRLRDQHKRHAQRAFYAVASVEFLEQPLPPCQWTALQTLSQEYQTPIALDESVATVQQLWDCWQQGWRGLFVVKGAIAGFPWAIRGLGPHPPNPLLPGGEAGEGVIYGSPLPLGEGLGERVIFSSVFETAIARQAVYQLAADLQVDRALGFGVQQWLEDDGLDDPDPTQVWQRLTTG